MDGKKQNQLKFYITKALLICHKRILEKVVIDKEMTMKEMQYEEQK